MSFDTPLLSAGSAFKPNYTSQSTVSQPLTNKSAQPSSTLMDELTYPNLFPSDSPNTAIRQLHHQHSTGAEQTYNILNGTTSNAESTTVDVRRLPESHSGQFDQLPGLEPLHTTPRSSNESTPSSSVAAGSLANSPNLFVPWRLSPLTYNKSLTQPQSIAYTPQQSISTQSPILLDRFSSYQSNNSGLALLGATASQISQHKSAADSSDSTQQIMQENGGVGRFLPAQPGNGMPMVKRDGSFQSAFGLGSPRLLSRNIGSGLMTSPELQQLQHQRNVLQAQRNFSGFMHTGTSSLNPSPSPSSHPMGLQPSNRNLSVNSSNKLANTVMQQQANVKPEQLQQWREMHLSEKSPSVDNDTTQPQSHAGSADNTPVYGSTSSSSMVQPIKQSITKSAAGRLTPQTGPMSNIDSTPDAQVSRSSTPTHKHGRDRSVKAAMRINIDHKDSGIVLEVINRLYTRPSCEDDPPVPAFKIRLIKITNKATNKVDVYIHAADLGGVVERKSNISRLFGQFDSPTEKLLMSVSGAHNHSIGQESNILTYAGVVAFFNQKKMKSQPHYRAWIESDVLPEMRSIGTTTQPGNAVQVMPAKDRLDNSDGESEEEMHVKKRVKRKRASGGKNDMMPTPQMVPAQHQTPVPQQQHVPQPSPMQPQPQQPQQPMQFYPQVQPPYFPPPTMPTQYSTSQSRPSPTIYHRQLQPDYGQQYGIPYASYAQPQYAYAPPPNMHQYTDDDYNRMNVLQHQHSTGGVHHQYSNSPYAGSMAYSQQQMQAMQSPLMPRY